MRRGPIPRSIPLSTIDILIISLQADSTVELEPITAVERRRYQIPEISTDSCTLANHRCG